MSRAKSVVSAGIVVYVNGSPFGRVKSFSWESATPKKPIYAIDALQPFELLSVATKIVCSMTVQRTIGDGGVEGASMTTVFENIPAEKYVTIQLVERVSDTLIFQATYCSVTHQGWDVPEKGVVIGKIDFEALEWNNEFNAS